MIESPHQLWARAFLKGHHHHTRHRRVHRDRLPWISRQVTTRLLPNDDDSIPLHHLCPSLVFLLVHLSVMLRGVVIHKSAWSRDLRTSRCPRACRFNGVRIQSGWTSARTFFPGLRFLDPIQSPTLSSHASLNTTALLLAAVLVGN